MAFNGERPTGSKGEDASATENLSTFNATFSYHTASRQTRTQREDAADSLIHEQGNDFLSLLTVIANLYKQSGVLEMQESKGPDSGQDSSFGATSTVTTIQTSYARPSSLDSYKTEKFVIGVKKKSYSTSLYHGDGRPRDLSMTRKFMTECRILSDARIRNCGYVVELLGLHWDTSQSDSINPVLILELAPYNLEEFLTRYPSLPFITKVGLASHVAGALEFVHALGVVHGDVKPQNILIFEDPLRAKLADFGHSMFKTSDRHKLAGGTQAYAAPEWEAAGSFSQLKLTDVYSYGIVFASVMAGCDISRLLIKTIGPHLYETMKHQDELYEIFREDLEHDHSHSIEDPNLVRLILENTVRTDTQRRDLGLVIKELRARAPPPYVRYMIPLIPSSDTSQRMLLAIPYQAMEPLGNRVKDQTLRNLHRLAENVDDCRHGDVCWELTVCYCSEFGLPIENTQGEQHLTSHALHYLRQSAESGDHRARLAILPIFEALGQQVPYGTTPVIEWLQELADEECQMAQAQLNRLAYDSRRKMKGRQFSKIVSSMYNDQNSGEVALDSKGESTLHIAASCGDLQSIASFFRQHPDPSEINRQNHYGDTPLLQAMRAGHVHLIEPLVSHRADGQILNHAREGPLHFLAYLEDPVQAQNALDSLMRAGAWRHLQTPALSSTHKAMYSLTPTGPGTPALRAVLAGNTHALQILLSFEAGATQSGLRTSNAMLRQLLAHAVKLRHVDIMEVLLARIEPSDQGHQIEIWNNGRRMTIEELWIHGFVSTNETCGYDWPEKFSRIISFGPLHQTVLKDSYDLLCRHGYFKRDHHAYMRLAIRNSRRDSVTCLATTILTSPGIMNSRELHPMIEYPQPGVQNWWRDAFPDAAIIRDSGTWAKTWAASEPNGPSSLADPSASWSFKNHRWAWVLAEWIDFAILNDQRGIFSDLLRFGNGLALAPGPTHWLKARRKFELWRARDTDPQDQSSVVDYGHLLPPPASRFSFEDASTLDDDDSMSRNAHCFNGTLNYALMYMNTISRIPQRDMSMPHILLNAMLEVLPASSFLWVPQSEFEEVCLGSSTFLEPSIVCPLYHATVNGREDLTRFLSEWGATMQDRPTYLDGLSKTTNWKETTALTSITQVICITSSEPYDRLAKLINISTEVSPGNVVSLQDLQTILLQPRSADMPKIASRAPFYYTLSIRWRVDEDRCKLTWDKPHSLRMSETELWTAIDRATQTQTLLSPFQNRRSHLITLAAMQQNIVAIRLLLSIGLLPVLRRPWNPYLVSSAKAFTEWTAIIPDSDCTADGLELKERHRLISQLLSEHDAADFGDLWTVMFMNADYWMAKFDGLIEALAFIIWFIFASIAGIIGGVIVIAFFLVVAALIVGPGIGLAYLVIRDSEAKLFSYPLGIFFGIIITIAIGSTVYGCTVCCGCASPDHDDRLPAQDDRKPVAASSRSRVVSGRAGYIANVGYAGSMAALVASRSGYLDAISLLWYSRVQKAWANMDQIRNYESELCKNPEMNLTGSMLDRWLDVTDNIDKLGKVERTLRSSRTKVPMIWRIFTRFYEWSTRLRRRSKNDEANSGEDRVLDVSDAGDGSLQIDDSATTTTPTEQTDEDARKKDKKKEKKQSGETLTQRALKQGGTLARKFFTKRVAPAVLWLISMPIKAADFANTQERRRLIRQRMADAVGQEEELSLLGASSTDV